MTEHRSPQKIPLIFSERRGARARVAEKFVAAYNADATSIEWTKADRAKALLL